MIIIYKYFIFKDVCMLLQIPMCNKQCVRSSWTCYRHISLTHSLNNNKTNKQTKKLYPWPTKCWSEDNALNVCLFAVYFSK